MRLLWIHMSWIHMVDTYSGYMGWIVDVREEASKIQGVGTFAAATICVVGGPVDQHYQLPL